MGKFTRCVFVGGSFFLLAAGFIACKTLVRQSVSDITAISDNHLTLGIVPIQSDNGMQAYRMLLCKKSAAYPSSMLEDKNRCRVALYDRSGTEVAFLPNTFRRDFGAKYKGYAKKATIMSLAIIPFAIVGARAGASRHAKKLNTKLNTMKMDLDKSGKMPTATFTDDLIQKGFGDDGYRYYEEAYDQQFDLLMKELRSDKNLANKEATIDLLEKHRSIGATLEVASELKIEEDSRKLVDEIAGMSPDKKVARLADLEKEIKALNNGVLRRNDDGSFVKEFENLQDRLAQLIEDSRSSVDSSDSINLNIDIDEIERLSKSYREDLLRYDEFIAKTDILRQKENLDVWLRSTDKKIAGLKDMLLGQEMARLRGSVESTKLNELRGRDTKIGAAGGAGLAAAIMLAIDKSIWGYADRQVSKHWNQIFVENDDFKDTRRVKDVRFILQTLADRFDYVVSQRALQLAN